MNRIKALFFALMVLLFPAGILHAQLDPRLQGTSTDFLDLYQQSSTATVKPEILTIFDFSGTMNRLMYHPQYVNSDSTDDGSSSKMTFTLRPGVAGVNTYTVTAKSAYKSAVWASVDLSVAKDGTFSASNYKTSNKYTGTNPSGLENNSGGGIFTSSSEISVVISGNSVTLGITFYIYNNTTNRTRTVDGGAAWSSTGGSLAPASTSDSFSLPAKSLHSHLNQTVWKAPSYDPGIAASISGTFSNSSATCTQLIKPDGTVVTADDASGASQPSGLSLNGIGGKDGDIRNWVRAASHARFVYMDDGTKRTVDIPIPWKVTSRASSGNPLSSYVVRDRIRKGTVDYGSNLDIEVDTTYAVNSGAHTLSGGGDTRTSTELSLVAYMNSYLTWIFTGKYQGSDSSQPYYSPTNAGKYIVFDAATSNLAAGQGTNLAWGRGFGTFSSGDSVTVPQLKLNGSYEKEVSIHPARQVLPAMTRCQAVKRAAIQTWIQFQGDVLWAVRFLDGNSQEVGATSIDNDSTAYLSTSDPTAEWVGGGDSGWRVLNNTSSQGITSTSGNSVKGMKRLAALFADTCTPLTYAMARGLAQFTDPNSVFNDVEPTPSQCMNHFLLLFTDGLDNNGCHGYNTNANTPYVNGDAFDALKGNQAILANSNGLAMPSFGWGGASSGANWNLFTFAGIAAHMADAYIRTGAVDGTDYKSAKDPGSGVTSGSPASFLPFAIKKRNGTTFQRDHRITTMTVGVSLGGLYTESGAKRNLFLAAAVGDPEVKSGSLSAFSPFQWDPTKNSGRGGKKDNTLYFFDATDPDKLIESLGYAIQSAVGSSNINTSANPNTPYIGASLGQEIYVGKFQPPLYGGAIWDGDLMMFGTRVKDNQLQIINRNGDPTTTLDDTTSQWSTKAAMAPKTWSSRTLYTRVPGNSNLVSFSDQGDGYAAIKTQVAQKGSNAGTYTADSDAQKQLIQFVMGGDTSKTALGTRPEANRSNIMGDIINSSPAAVEYKWSYITEKTQDAITTDGGTRFRLILVGTNQGWLHAFGEVTWDTTINDVSGNPKCVIKQGRVAELWAFMPTDFLGYLDQIFVSSNTHRFMVDGSPVVYHLDLPASTGGMGDGVVGSGERAVVVFGLGKGGRSYYALDISDPFKPSLRWSLVPDDAAGLTEDAIQDSASKPSLDAVKSVVGKMGYSTCIPGIGRITLKSSDKAILRDAIFLGGGFSRPEIEVAGKFGTPLGRSALALDAYSGKILAVQDISDVDGNGNPKYGPVVKGVVPFEFFINSGMAQRAYFLDYWGGLWAWGGTDTDSRTESSTYQYRKDTSELSAWGLRRVAQDRNGSALKDAAGNATSQTSEALYTTLPAPFRVGTFPGKARSAGKSIPAVVGIAMESGDRNNPLDQAYPEGAMPSHHRISVVFDRQDSEAWGTDANPIVILDQKTPASATASGSDRVMDAFPGGSSFAAGDAVITPGNDAYYLAPMKGEGLSRTMDTGNTKFGFYRKFPDIAAQTTYLPKGINTPAVVSGSLFYSFFTPTSVDVCVGGTGRTYSNVICDVLNPIVSDEGTNLSCTSGLRYTWYGTASDYIPFGTRGVIQIGTTATTNPDTAKVTTALAFQTLTGQGKAQYPKPRVWRTVH